MHLKDKNLLKNKAYINGEWVSAKGGNTFPVINPFDQSIITHLPDMGKDETLLAINAAHTAFAQWRALSASERSQLLKKWQQKISENLDDLALLLTLEQGKPLAQAHDSAESAANAVGWYAAEAERLHGQTLMPVSGNRRILIIKQPVGVVGVITPWNFPLSICAQKCAAVLASGCTVVLKPSEDTPLTALALVELADRAGLPKGMLNVVTCESAIAVGKELTSNPLVRKITFTGSTEVGKILFSQSADTVKKLCLEMGGNSPFIVFEDANLDKAVEEAVAKKFLNAGQVCTNINRFLLHEKIHDVFVDKFTIAAKKIKLGSGLSTDTMLGPLINEAGVNKVEELVQDAITKGAKLIMGGKRASAGNLFYEPTVLVDMDSTMRIYQEEIFGPVAAFFKFKSDDEAIAMANDTHYGLASYFYTQKMDRIWRLGEALETGVVGINSGNTYGLNMPFGGFKESGIGREGGIVGALDEYCEIKSLVFGLD